MKLLPLALLLVACSTAAPSPTPSPTPTPVIPGLGEVTIRVGTEEYRILITDPADMAIAERLLAGDDTAPSIPNGKIVRDDPSINEGWSWSIDPETLEFADMTTEVCDGLPSYVEDGSLTGDYFCPWSAEIIHIGYYATAL